MRENVTRLDLLRGQQIELTTGAWFARSAGVMLNLDPQLARGTLATFEPALSLTVSGLIYAVLGFILSHVVFSLGARASARSQLSTRHA
jgi:Protein of unknown function (DUF2937)